MDNYNEPSYGDGFDIDDEFPSLIQITENGYSDEYLFLMIKGYS